ncbi:MULTISPECIES: hypothetical protein [Clostridium]|uniref:Glucose/Sorbosone dehydrogenase domain-containing protein n=1 Tax=Clostridium lapidicellarium TaxID=3240931 RepID=A0ABV4DUE1_9CLOT
MKKLLKVLSILIFISAAAFTIQFYFNKTHPKIQVELKDNALSCNLKYSGLEGSVDFTKDEKNNYYIAYKDRIQVIGKNGKSCDIMKDPVLDIHSIDYSKDNLYYSSGDKIYRYNLKQGKNTVLLKNIPNYGDYKDSLLRINGDCIYISIGSATNSAVVGDDNKWVKENFYAHDVTPEDITLGGINFGKYRRGAFQSYNTRSLKGQIVPKHFPGNASVITYDINNGNSETFAWGIRNINGMDFTSTNKLICSVGGMENRGSRPVVGDTDYIYEIKKGIWYGWPDYSGGDPVISPKFKSVKGSPLQFVLDNHPSTNPPAPLYQHKNVGTLGSIAVDSSGNLKSKDCIFFYDNSDNMIYSSRGAGSPLAEIELGKNSIISSMKICDESLMILDEKEGYLYSIKRGKVNAGTEIGRNIYLYLLLTVILSIILILKNQNS